MIKMLQEKIDIKYIPYIITSLIMFCCFSISTSFHDDIRMGAAIGIGKVSFLDSLKMIFTQTYNYYLSYSPRIFINFSWFLSLLFGTKFFAFISGCIIFIFLCFIDYIHKTNLDEAVKISILLLLYRFNFFWTAGWMSATINYLWPIVLGLVSLIPIIKHHRDEKLSFSSCLLYSFCLVYGANAEQVMVFVLFTYTVFCIYYYINKNNSVNLWVQEFLAIISFLICILCPGNKLRIVNDTINYFPDFKMLSFIDKLELGLTTTLYDIFILPSILIIVIIMVIQLLIYEKYDSNVIKVISFLPTFTVLYFGIFSNFFAKLIPEMNIISLTVPRLGMVNVDSFRNYGIGLPAIEFIFLLMVGIVFFINVAILFDDLFSKIFYITLLISGFAGRIAMGLAPSIYATGYRSYSVLYFILLLIGIKSLVILCRKFNYAKKYLCIWVSLCTIGILKAIILFAYIWRSDKYFY